MLNNNPISLIIPMAGQGKRFFDNGFDTYKPFLNISGRSMVDGVLEPFKEIQTIFILTTSAIYSENRRHFDKLPNNVTIVIIAEHKLGPAYSIYLARNSLPLNHAYIIAYCDVWWNVSAFSLSDLNQYEAAVFVHRGFHPHLVGDNFSAFCREDSDSVGYLREIREKGSFTDDWMSEPVSIGIFYVKDANLLFESINNMIEVDLRAAGEYYPSIIFNSLVSCGVPVKLIDVNSFVHIGVPSQFNDLILWSNIINTPDKLAFTEKAYSSVLNCMLIGGSGARMRSVSEKPKHSLPVEGEPMFHYVANKFGLNKNILIGAPNFSLIKSLESKYEVNRLKRHTGSHLETMARALDFLPHDMEVLFTSCDCYGDIDWSAFNRFVAENNAECIIFSFQPSLLQIKNSGQHTSVNIVNNVVVDVDIKSKNKDYKYGLAGFFWFKNKAVVYDLLNKLPKNTDEEYLVDHLILEKSKSHHKPMAYHLETYVHLGTPNEYKEFNYWSSRGRQLISASK